GNAFPLDDTVTDEPDRTCHYVGPAGPFGRPRSRVRTAAFARPEARFLGCGGRRVEPDVRSLRGHGRAAGPAVDAGRDHGNEKDAVETAVPPRGGPVTVLEIHPCQHG